MAPSRSRSVSDKASRLFEARQRESRSSRIAWFGDVLRLRGSAIHRAWHAVIYITLWTVAVAVAEINYGRNWRLTNSVVPLLSVVVGLLLVFRNGSAYERWKEGRTTFGAMSSVTRTATRYAWINLGLAPYDPDRTDQKGDVTHSKHAHWTAQEQRDKATACRLFVAVMVATKHHVRNEFGTDFEDLRALVPSDLLKTFSGERSYGAIPSSTQYNNHHAEPSSEQTVFVENEFVRPDFSLPLIILHHLALYFAKQKARGFMDALGPAGYNTINSFLSAMTEEIQTVERLSRTPLPFVYGIHLKQCVTLYLFLLPLCLVEQMGFQMIGFVSAFAFVLIGIEAIAAEIEMPFDNSDYSDLPLDLWCDESRIEVEHMISSLPDSLESL